LSTVIHEPSLIACGLLKLYLFHLFIYEYELVLNFNHLIIYEYELVLNFNHLIIYEYELVLNFNYEAYDMVCHL
jgi:hypothetical protein